MTTMTKSMIRLLNFDPGLTMMGWSLIEYDLITNHKTIVKQGTITGKTILKSRKDLQQTYEKKFIILWELEAILAEMMTEYDPDYVVSEDAFAHLFPQAFAALVLVIFAIRTAARKVLNKDIHLIAPRESKKAVSASGTSDKIAVQAAIGADPTISFRTLKSSQGEEITEHAYDSIGAGIAFIQNHLPSILAAEQLV